MNFIYNIVFGDKIDLGSLIGDNHHRWKPDDKLVSVSRLNLLFENSNNVIFTEDFAEKRKNCAENYENYYKKAEDFLYGKSSCCKSTLSLNDKILSNKFINTENILESYDIKSNVSKLINIIYDSNNFSNITKIHYIYLLLLHFDLKNCYMDMNIYFYRSLLDYINKMVT